MLFDLKTGKRRRVIQVVFGFLAFIFFISFVGFGIGSDVSGGIFDAIGLGDGGSGDTQYEQQIEDAEKELDADPRDQQALADLVQYNYLAATEAGIEQGEDGLPVISAAASAQLEDAVAAWEDYRALKPQQFDETAASNAVQAFVLLNDADGAAQAQRIVAEQQDSFAAWGQLAYFLYADGQIKQGDKAADEAVAAADPSQRKQVERNMEALHDQAVKQQQALKQAQQQGGGQDDAGAGIADPFGDLGGSGLPQTAP